MTVQRNISYKVDGHYAIGATYVTDAGDTTVTLGAGLSETEGMY